LLFLRKRQAGAGGASVRASWSACAGAHGFVYL
jgi:hypothetical protein